MLRDARQVFTRPLSGAARAAIVAALVCVGILAAGVRGPGERGRSAVAAEPQGKLNLSGAATIGKKEPFDLSQISRDSNLILAARPWQVLTQKELEPFAKLFNEIGFKEKFGLTVESLDEIVFASRFPAIGKRNIAGAPDAAAPSSPSKERIVLRTKAPIDEAKFPLRFPEVGPAKFDEVAGKKLYLADRPNDFSYFFPNESTVVLGETEELRDWLKSGAKSNWAPPGWDEVSKSDAAVWLDVKSIRPMLNDAKNTLEMQMLSPFSVLWEETDTLVAGATFDDRMKVRAIAHCTSPENAERVQKTLEAAITLATNSLKSLDSGPGPGLQEAQLTLFARFGIKLASEVKVTRTEAKVEATVDAPVDSLVAFSAIAPAVSDARDAARRAQSTNNMKQLALAMHNYADANKHFPPAVLLGPDGKTPYSWRVALLPYLEINGKKLYEEYNRNEPWDSENNKNVLAKMPAVFRCPQDDPKSLNTSYFAVVGPQTLFHDNTGTAFRQITDGTSNTIMFVDAKRDIPWTKPEDIQVPADKPLPKFGGWFSGVSIVALADGSVRAISETADEKTIRALLSRGGGEPVAASDLDKK